MLAAVVVMAAALTTAQSASAQTFLVPAPAVSVLASDTLSVQSASVRRGPARKAKRGLRVYGIVESETMTATRSFEATLGTPRFVLKGAGVDAVGIVKGVFLRLALTQGRREGQRVFATTSGQVTPLGIPLTVQMTPLEIGGGWRFGAFDRRRHLVPFVGINGVWLRYKETSQFAEPGEDTDETFKGASVFGGIDIGISLVRVGIEALYRRIPHALGDNGLAKTFGESDLGGGVVRLTIGIGF